MAVRRAVRQVGQGRVLLPGWVFRPGHGVPPSPGSSRRCVAEHERCKLDCRSGAAARPFGGATLLQLGPHRDRGSAEPGGQQRTAGDNERRGQQRFRSHSPWQRNTWTALHTAEVTGWCDIVLRCSRPPSAGDDATVAGKRPHPAPRGRPTPAVTADAVLTGQAVRFPRHAGIVEEVASHAQGLGRR